MTPLLSMLAGARAFGITFLRNLFQPSGGYDALATINLTSSASSIVFSGIPQGYKDIQICGIARTDMNSGGAWSPISLRFNSDTGANYSIHTLGGTGSGSGFAEGYASQTSTTAGFGASSTNVANSFGASIIDIVDYQNINKNKTVRLLNGVDNNGSGLVVFQSGAWYSTDAITTITLGLYGGNNGSNFLANTEFTLYGIR